jgi:hypothetical protein
MSRLAWRTGGILIGLAFLVGVALLTEATARFSAEESALLRLSWRLPAGEGVDCRRPTPEELAELPAHMRNPDACSGGSHPGFTLRVLVDGADVVTDTLYPAGSRHDRPIYVFRELPIASGRRALRVRFEQNAGDGTDGEAERRLLEWEDEVNLRPREIVLLGYDQDTQTLQPVRHD